MRLKFLRPYYITLNFFRQAHKRVSFFKKVCRYECMLQYVILKSRKILAADCNWFQYNRGCARAIYFPSGFCLYVIRFVYIHRIYASFDRSKAHIVNTLREKLRSVFGHAARAFLNTMFMFVQLTASFYYSYWFIAGGCWRFLKHKGFSQTCSELKWGVAAILELNLTTTRGSLIRLFCVTKWVSAFLHGQLLMLHNSLCFY